MSACVCLVRAVVWVCDLAGTSRSHCSLLLLPNTAPYLRWPHTHSHADTRTPDVVVAKQVLALVLLVVLLCHGVLSEALAVCWGGLRVVVWHWLIVIQPRANVLVLQPAIVSLGGLFGGGWRGGERRTHEQQLSRCCCCRERQPASQQAVFGGMASADDG